MQKSNRWRGFVSGCAAGSLTLASAWLGAGCASSAVDQPRQAGAVDTPPEEGVYRVRIWSTEPAVRRGTPVTFQIEIRNAGSEAVWIPRSPSVVFAWVYPNGQRDNEMLHLSEAQRFDRSNAMRLPPGGTVRRTALIGTRFFPRVGITEFGAYLHVPRNTNPGLAPFPDGRFRSNRYGVAVTD